MDRHKVHDRVRALPCLRRLGAAAREGAIPGDSLEDGVLRIERAETPAPEHAEDVVLDLYRRLPSTRITDILLEVDDATGFTDAFGHLRTGSPCRDRIGLLCLVLAEGVTWDCARMADATAHRGFWELMRIARWHVEGEAYERALAAVEAQAALPMAAFWGSGRTASGDGQFFPAGGRGETMNLVNARYGFEPGGQGLLARLRPLLAVRDPDHPGDRQRSPLHPRRPADERDGAARPRAVRRHRGLHRPRVRRLRRFSGTPSSRAYATCPRSVCTCSAGPASRRRCGPSSGAR